MSGMDTRLAQTHVHFSREHRDLDHWLPYWTSAIGLYCLTSGCQGSVTEFSFVCCHVPKVQMGLHRVESKQRSMAKGQGRSCHLRIVHKEHLRAEEMAQLSEGMLGKYEGPR